MIIWGSRTRSTTTEDGVFYCPQERGDRPFAKKTAKQWFTLYFIAVFPMNDLGEFVECQICNSQFDTRVLEIPTSHALAANLTTAMRHGVVAIISADGQILDIEKSAAVDVMRRYDANYTLEHLEHDIANIRIEDTTAHLTQCVAGLDSFGKETLIAQIAYLAAIDGQTPPAEIAVIGHIGQVLAMTHSHIKGVMDGIFAAQNVTAVALTETSET